MKDIRINISLYIIIPIIIAGIALMATIAAFNITVFYTKRGLVPTWPVAFWGTIIVLITALFGLLIVKFIIDPVKRFAQNTESLGVIGRNTGETTPVQNQDDMGRYSQLFDQVTDILSQVEARELFPSIVGQSKAMRGVLKQILQVAKTDSTVLILGETGTGKELIAKSIHQHSNRKNKDFIALNCAAIPESLLESELFGHEKGAFTEILTKKRGKLELADKGTLYMDEIGDMSVKTQATVLRVLQEKQFQRVGGSRTINVDVRVIAATNKNLEEEIAKGNFREDLYYLLNAIPLAVPSLRDRSEDIPLLVESFLEECAVKNRKDKKGISREALDLLCSYSWPGNVSELKNLVERLAIMVEKDIIDVSDMPSPYCPEAVECVPSVQEQLLSINHLKEAVKAFEKEFIQRRLAEENNNITRTAEAIGVKRSYLYRKLKSL